MRNDENCFCFQRNVFFFFVFPFFKFPCKIGIFSSFPLHASHNFFTIALPLLRWSFLTHAQQASLENDQRLTSRKPSFSESTAC